MSYMLLMIVLVVIAFVFLIGASLILFHRGWFIKWLRGSSGVIMLVLAVLLVLAAFDFSSYRALTSEEPLATVSFEQLAPQRYKAMVSIADDDTFEYELAGDMWQIDAKIITWQGPIAAMGLLPGFRLDCIGGRYLSIEQEKANLPTVYQLSNPIGLDVWNVLNSSKWMPWSDATYGSATFVPMKHGALFAVQLTPKGLIARPLNEPAEKAVKEWG